MNRRLLGERTVRALAVLQAVLLIATLAVPIAVLAADPTPPPTPTADATPPAPESTPEATPVPTPEATPEATPEPSDAPPAVGAPTISTDLNDYWPGSTVHVFGADWTANSEISLTLYRDDPLDPNDGFAGDFIGMWTTMSLDDGSFEDASWTMTWADFNMVHKLVAVGPNGTAIAFFQDSAATDCFRSKQSGNWNDTNTWESAPSPCTVWTNANLTPTSSANTVTVRAGHTVTVSAAASVRLLVVDGTLTISPSQTLSTTGGSPQITVSSTGIIDVNGTFTAGSSSGSTAMSVSGTLNVAGPLSFPNGLPSLTFNSGSNLAVTAAGSIAGSGGASATLTLSSGATATNAGPISSWGAILVNGTLTSSGNISSNPGSGGGNLAVAGTLTMTAGTLTSTRGNGGSVGSISSGGTIALQGSSIFSIGTVGTASYTVANGGTLEIGPSAVVSGAAQLATASGATLKIASASGVNGNVTSATSFDPGTKWTFNGASQVTGSLLPAHVGNLTVAETSGNLTLSSSTTVSGTLALTSGDLLTGASVLGMLSSATSTGTTDVVGTVARSNLPTGSLVSFGNPDNGVTITSGSIPNSTLGTLGLGMTVSATTGTVNETATPPAVPFVILIGTEQILVTGRTGAANPRSYTIVRGVNGTTAASHSNGSAISLVGQLSFKLVKSAPSGKSDAVLRTYTLTPSATFSGTASIRFHYLDSELNGNAEGSLHLWKDVAGTWTDQDPTGDNTARDMFYNVVEQAGFSSFSDWTLASPVATDGVLTVTKSLTTDNGGDATCDDFSFTVDGGSPITFEADCSNDVTVSADDHTVVESGTPIAGYSTSYGNNQNANVDCAGLAVANGQLSGEVTCTISNNDIAPTLLVKKHVVTDNGGSATAADWLLSVTSSNGGSGTGSANGSESGTLYTLEAGKAYSVGESGGPAGYSESPSGDCTITSADLDTEYTCTITNDDQQAYITVVKSVTNDNGGDADPDDFGLTLEGDPVSSGVAVPVNPGTYTAAEAGLAGYAFVGFTDDCDTNGDVTVALGESKTCTITNDDEQGTLRVTKVLPNDSGGDASCDDFSFTVDGGASIPFESDCSNDVLVDAGDHDVVEDGTQSGYALSYANSENGDANCTDLAIVNGGAAGDVECTITNDDHQGVLTVTKDLTTDNGSLASCDDFSFTVDGGSPIAFESDCSNDVAVNAGAHTVVEDGAPLTGFATTYANSENGNLDCASLPVVNGGAAGDVTCTISNDDLQGTLTVTKSLTTDNGSDAVCEDFSFIVDGGAPIAFESDCSNDVLVDAGSHDVVEDGSPIDGFTTSYGNSENITADCQNLYVANGGAADDVTCTISNDDQQGVLTVTKSLTTDNGSDAVCEDFSFTIDGGSPIAFESDCSNDVLVDAGDHSVVESGTPIAGFSTSYTNNQNANLDCADLAVANGDASGDVTCTVTNDDEQGTLTVTKSLPNDNGGNATCDDFTFTVDGGGSIAFESDCSNDVLVDAGDHTVVEDGTQPGYAVSYANSENSNTDCTSLPVVNGGAAGDVVCTITNDDQPGVLTVAKSLTTDNGSAAVCEDFSFIIDGGSPIAFEADCSNDVSVDAGSHTVVEDGAPLTAFSTGYSNSENANLDCASLPVVNGGSAGDVVCTISNNDLPGTLRVTKVLTVDNGSLATCEDFSFTVDGGSPIAFDADCSNDVLVNAGSHDVVEDGLPISGFTTTYSNSENGNLDCQSLPVANGGAAGDMVCTITNDDQQGTLTITKVLPNDSGSDAVCEDFSFTIDAGSPIAFESDCTNEIAVDAGSYSLVEDGTPIAGFTTTYTNNLNANTDCASLTVANGGAAGDVVCTITNDDQQGTLRITKVLPNNNGGDAECDDFTFTIDGGGPITFDSDCSNDVLVDAGAHSVLEDGTQSGYSVSYTNSENADTDCADLAVVNGGAAGDVECTITNDDQQGVLTVVKDLTTNDGSLADCEDFSFTVDGGAPIAFESDCSNDVYVNAGAHDVVEDGAPVSGFSTTYANSQNANTDCQDLAVVNGGAAGGVTCTISNDDLDGILTITKDLTTDNGSLADCADFSFTVDGGSPIAFESDCSNDVSVDAGQHDVVEYGSPIAGFTTSYANSENITADCQNLYVANGGLAGAVECTISNDDQQGVLTVAKVLPNDNGGNATCDDFTFTVDGGSSIAFESDCSNDVLVDAGSHTVVEDGTLSGYTTSYANSENSNLDCASLAVVNGGAADDVICTITNDDQQGTLTVTKSLPNDNGGNATCDDFTFTVDGGGSIAFEADCSNDVLVDAGSHTVVEDGTLSGYAVSYANNQNANTDCASLAVVNGGAAGAVTCTITNDDIAPTILVKKHVVNNNGGGAAASAWLLTVSSSNGGSGTGNAAGSETGTLYTLQAGKAYSVGESGGASGYSASSSADCTIASAVLNTAYTCTITNDDQPATLTVIKTVTNDNGGNATANQWTMIVTATNPSNNNFAGAESPGTTVAIDAGSFSVGESGGPNGYALSSSGCSGTAVVGGSYTCTLTNNDIQPVVTVTKKLVPAADPGRFNLLIGGTQYATNVGDNGTTGPIGINAGTRAISETGGTVPPTNLANYTSSINCGAKGSGSGSSLNINLNPGDVVSCLITNTIQDADADGIPNFLDCTSLYESRVVDPTGSLAAYLPASRRHATLQLAVNAAADNDVISMYANTTENVEIGGAGVGAAAAGKDLRIVGCGRKVTAANPSKPVINILSNAGKNDGTNTGAGERDIHIDDLDVRGGTYGYLVQTSKPGGTNTSTILKSIRATNNGVGVSIVGSGNELRGANGISFNTSGGVQVNGNNNSINNNRIESNTGAGLSVAGGGLDINKNIVTGNSGNGIVVVGCAANKIQENDVFSNGGAGIVVSGNASLIKKNQVGDSGKGNNGDGITVNASSTEISENNVYANNGRGIVVTGNTNVVKKNKVGDAGKGNTSDGIKLTGDGNTVGKDVDQNDVFANGGSGIVVTGNNNKLSKNDVGDRGKGNGGDGFRVVGYGNILTENDSFANGGDGFDISGGTAAKPNVLVKNNAGKSNAGNGGNGFLVAGTGNAKAAPTELDQNTAKGNTLNGFYVTGTGMDLSKNMSGGNSGDDNGDWEFLVGAAGNWNLGGNKYGTTTLAGATPSAWPTGGLGTP